MADVNGSRPDGEPGSVADEAMKLLETIQDWTRRTFGDSAGSHDCSAATVCEWCPLCQVIAMLRGDRPEATEKLVAAGSAVLSALRAILDSTASSPSSSASTQPPSDDEPSTARVQRINLAGE